MSPRNMHEGRAGVLPWRCRTLLDGGFIDTQPVHVTGKDRWVRISITEFTWNPAEGVLLYDVTRRDHPDRARCGGLKGARFPTGADR